VVRNDRDIHNFLSIIIIGCYNLPRATVAQLAEQPLRKRRVKGSIPFGGSFILVQGQSEIIMINQKWNYLCILVLLFSLSSCSWFTNKGADNTGSSDIKFDAEQTSTSELPIYQKFDCIPSSELPETGFVIDVIDGDSIKAKIGDKVYEIRYIGINTPEYYSNEKAEAEIATMENSRLVKGKKIYLFKDRSDTDKFHRLLRYVFTNEYFVNYELVKRGLAKSKAYFPDTACQNIFNQAAQ
jgi:endonuclease YncB( thermonuclease family)